MFWVAAIFNFQFWAGTVGMSSFPAIFEICIPKTPFVQIFMLLSGSAHLSQNMSHIRPTIGPTRKRERVDMIFLLTIRTISRQRACVLFMAIAVVKTGLLYLENSRIRIPNNQNQHGRRSSYILCWCQLHSTHHAQLKCHILIMINLVEAM